MKPKVLDRVIVFTSIVGILLSTYAMYVEMAVESQPGYKALCDISEYASCSRVLSSEFSKGFGLLPEESPLKVPNCIYGIIFYCLIIFLSTFDQLLVARLLFVGCLSSVAMCFYLAYLLAFVLHDLCVVCISTYIVNGLLTALVYKKTKALAAKKK
ncbi:vitamin K epoxide reductase complex subunit 1-like protein 1 [Anticarsia gemmatalis]|uniref:vitamin K epoxide reductase complex subunit 1-like protein 1 n=1 Tax=Anticarsia gemmatalis TaxID=129554 RepID=UPI003F759EB2